MQASPGSMVCGCFSNGNKFEPCPGITTTLPKVFEALFSLRIPDFVGQECYVIPHHD